MVQIELSKLQSKQDAQEYREQVVSQMLDLVQNVTETSEGYTLDVGRQEESFNLLAAFVKIERFCQPFLRMSLLSESNGGPLKVDVAGPAGTKDFMQTEYGLRRWLDN